MEKKFIEILSDISNSLKNINYELKEIRCKNKL